MKVRVTRQITSGANEFLPGQEGELVGAALLIVTMTETYRIRVPLTTLTMRQSVEVVK